MPSAVDPIVRSIAENSPDLIMVLDREARIQFINRTVPDLTIEQVLGTPTYNYVPHDYHDAMRACFERVVKTGQPDYYEVAYVAQNGDTTYWESRVGPVVRDGEVVAFVIVGRNVTELRMEAFARDRFFHLSIDMLCVVDRDGAFERVNPAFERTLGHAASELVGAKTYDFVHPDDRERTREAGRAILAGQSAIDFENRYRRKDGEYRWLSWRAVAEPDGSRVYGIARDVTEQKLLEAQLQHSQKLDAIGQLAGGVAHDFNNLLLAIRINTDGARERGSGDARFAAHLQHVKEAAERAANLTRQLLTFARRQPLHPEALDLNELTRDLHELLRRLIPENIELAFERCEEPCVIEADRAQIEQVLFNLCLNGRDAMPNGGTLRVALAPVRVDHRFCLEHPWAKPGRYVLLRVIDTGTGMSPEVQARLFEPFFTTKGQGLGTGLGLATAYGIVRRHGGLLHVQSVLGQGSIFEVYLPQSQLRPSAPERKAEEAPQGGSETILVAEDDELVRVGVVGLLERAGYNVIVAKDGVEAVELHRRFEQDIDLLLLDITMPRLGGPEALEEVRKLDPGVRAILTSGYANHSPKPVGGALLHKPYDPAALLRRVRAELDR